MFDWLHRDCVTKLEKEREKLYRFIAARDAEIKDLKILNHNLQEEAKHINKRKKEKNV